MRQVLFSFIILVGCHFGFSQTFQTTGSWDVPTNWSGGVVPGGTTDVTVSASPTISTSDFIGAVTDANSVTYTITALGTLTIGTSVTTKNMTFGNSGSISIVSGGKLEIWGDLTVSNNLNLNVAGTLIVHGNITMNNGATINISSTGTATVGGNLTAQTNNILSVSGPARTLNVVGSLTLGTGSSISSTGAFTAGSCSCPNCTSALTGCGNGNVLSVTLLFFKASAIDHMVHLSWATGSEIHFDYFILEQSATGIHFYDEAHIHGSGTSHSRKDYTYEDPMPFAGLSYYRITSIDFDGYSETFNENLISVKVEAQKKIQIFPNPASGGKITATTNFDLSPDAEIHIYSIVDNL